MTYGVALALSLSWACHEVSSENIIVILSVILSRRELWVIEQVNLVRVVFMLCSAVLRHHVNVEHLVTSTSRHFFIYLP
jgi:glycerol-3-phosphate acyltransferase PlsY